VGLASIYYNSQQYRPAHLSPISDKSLKAMHLISIGYYR
jgi:hypothetical protein